MKMSSINTLEHRAQQCFTVLNVVISKPDTRARLISDPPDRHLPRRRAATNALRSVEKRRKGRGLARCVRTIAHGRTASQPSTTVANATIPDVPNRDALTGITAPAVGDGWLRREGCPSVTGCGLVGRASRSSRCVGSLVQ